jgi:HK97 family phage major capsid protein
MIHELVKKRAAAFDAFKALADKPTLTAEEQADYDVKHRAVLDLDGQIKRTKDAQALAVETAKSVEGQESVIQAGDDDPYTSESAAKARGLGTHKGLRAVACAKIFDAAGRSVNGAREIAVAQYGERHPITRAFEMRRDAHTRALITSVGASGGFIVPPDYVNEIIELLRPIAVVRS